MKDNKLQLITAAAMCAGGLALLFVALYTGEIGKIAESVLVAVGECLTFAGALFGVDYHYKNK